MPKTRLEKEEALKRISEDLQNASSVIFVGYHGLSVSALERLRRELRAVGAKLEVVKKTLLRKAFAQVNAPVIKTEELGGGLALLVGKGDEVSPARILAGFKKENEILAIYGGILENRFIDSQTVLALARMLGREELRAKIVGSLNAPLAGLVNVIAGNLRGLINVLRARGQSI